jgi:hypothetical protein
MHALMQVLNFRRHLAQHTGCKAMRYVSASDVL